MIPVQPFEIHVEQHVLDDLRERLLRTRWPDQISGSGWERGTNLPYMQELIRYWADGYDWRAAERSLNQFQQFRAQVGGLNIHFIHERGEGSRPLPLIVTHGWPGSFAEMAKIIPLLAHPARYGGDPRDAFDVVVPSMPGFGFSDASTQPGMNVWRIGDLWADLMQGLGYTRFGAQGGDFGAGVSTVLGLNHAERVIGIHLNYIPGSYQPPDTSNLTAEEQQFLKTAAEWFDDHGAYAHVQRTTPQTLACALNDSPAGLAAWIVEKFVLWADAAHRFSPDELLTNVMIYWVAQTIHSSTRLYYEGRLVPMHFPPGRGVRVPCGVARFPKESPFPPRSWIERGYNLQRFTELPSGGHFAAMEQPEALVGEIRNFFRPLRA